MQTLPNRTKRVAISGDERYTYEKMHQAYIDATIPINLVARQSCDPKITRWQNITHEFWIDPGGTFMCDNPVKDIQKAKARLVTLFGDLETYMEFLMKQQVLFFSFIADNLFWR